MKNLKNNLQTALMVSLVFMPSLVYVTFQEVKHIENVMVGLMIAVLGAFLYMMKRDEKPKS
jgi:Cu/Ag efflux pump CusA